MAGLATRSFKQHPTFCASRESTMGANLSKRLERAEKTGVLSVQELGLTSLPDNIWRLRALRTLNVSSNKLLKIPPQIGA